MTNMDKSAARWKTGGFLAVATLFVIVNIIPSVIIAWAMVLLSLATSLPSRPRGLVWVCVVPLACGFATARAFQLALA